MVAKLNVEGKVWQLKEQVLESCSRVRGKDFRATAQCQRKQVQAESRRRTVSFYGTWITTARTSAQQEAL